MELRKERTIWKFVQPTALGSEEATKNFLNAVLKQRIPHCFRRQKAADMKSTRPRNDSFQETREGLIAGTIIKSIL